MPVFIRIENIDGTRLSGVRMRDCVAELTGLFAGKLFTQQQDMAPFLTDSRGMWHGNALAVALPDTVGDVARIIRWCQDHDVPVVPQGGNTGLSGAATPDKTGRSIVLSLVRLNCIRGIDKFNDTMVVEAGCLLQNIQDAARAADRLFPLSLAAEGSCTIGGTWPRMQAGPRCCATAMRAICASDWKW
jgi:FAD/FMN-containing dehydrogenase